LLITPWIEGIPGESLRGEGENLEAATIDALASLEPWPGGRTALVIDLARQQLPGGALPPGESGALADEGGLSPSVAWRPGGVRSERIFYKWSVPMITAQIGNASPALFDSLVVDDHGARELRAGWTAPEESTSESLRASALEGALMVARNQDSRGRFAYIIRGPGGTRGPGYNLPRHAGTTWFLAQMANQSGNAQAMEAARLGLEWMVERTTLFDEDKGAFFDARRKDGMIWVGTTSLAVLAAVELDHDIAPVWGRFLVDSMDQRGQIRGEANRADGGFSEQVQNPYGQGQTLLALAYLVQAGHEEFRSDLERGAAFVDGDYAPLGAGKLVTIDEHWACLAALAIRDALGSPAGVQLCEAYLRNHSIDPAPTEGLRGHVSAAGGVAEAVVAMAELDPEGPWKRRAMAYGDLFIEAQYRPGDAPFLERPEALIGGFRTTPYRLDVQIDTVQHVGSALLGIASLMDPQ